VNHQTPTFVGVTKNRLSPVFLRPARRIGPGRMAHPNGIWLRNKWNENKKGDTPEINHKRIISKTKDF